MRLHPRVGKSAHRRSKVRRGPAFARWAPARSRRSAASPREGGLALILVLFLSAALTALVYAFLTEMRVEHGLADGYGREAQARQLAWSAIEKAAATLDSEASPVAAPTRSWFDSSTEWYEVELGEGVYSLIHTPPEAASRPRYGIADESARVNLNAAPREILMKIPGMTDEIADAILDWRDPDDNITGQGAESSYYMALSPAYRCKNGPFDSVEELLLLKGVTPEIFYGEDLNRNGVLDAGENDGDPTPPRDNADGVLDFGLAAYFTAWSYDRNIRLDGSPRVNINTAQEQALRTALGDVLSPQEVQQITIRRGAFGGRYPTVAHLLPVQGIPGGLSVDAWKRVVDRVTIADEPTFPGLINVNTAGRKVLAALPGMAEEDVERLVAHRTRTDVDLSTIGWLADVLPPPKLQAIAAFVTTRAYQFRLDAVGRVGPKSERPAESTVSTVRDASTAPPPPRPMRRILAIYDRGGESPRVVYVRDVSRLGMPYPIEEPGE